MAVKDTLPPVVAVADRVVAAAYTIVAALDAQHRGQNVLMLHRARYALAHVRSWRKSLPEQGERYPDQDHQNDRQILRRALVLAAWADDGTNTADDLRAAEALLRTLIKRHQDGAR